MVLCFIIRSVWAQLLPLMHDACLLYIFSCKFPKYLAFAFDVLLLFLAATFLRAKRISPIQSIQTQTPTFYDIWINLQSAILMMLLTFIYKIINKKKSHSAHCEANQIVFFFLCVRTGPSVSVPQLKYRFELIHSYYLLVFEVWMMIVQRSFLLRSKVIFCVDFITHRYDFIAKINGRINYLQRFLWPQPAKIFLFNVDF